MLKQYFFCSPGSGASEATNRGRARECGALLPRAREHVLRPELPQSEPLEHPADPRQEGRPRARTARLRAHRDRTYTEQPTANGECTAFSDGT